MLRRAYVTSRSVYRPRVNHIPARPRTTNKILYLQAARHQPVRSVMQRMRHQGAPCAREFAVSQAVATRVERTHVWQQVHIHLVPHPLMPQAAVRNKRKRIRSARRRTVQMQTAPTLASTRSVNLRYSKRGGTNGESWTSYAGSSSLRPRSQTLTGARRRHQAHPGRSRGSWSAARGEASSFSDVLSPAWSPALLLSPPFFLSGFCPCLVNGGSYRL